MVGLGIGGVLNFYVVFRVDVELIVMVGLVILN